jgi:hypothetical protein
MFKDPNFFLPRGPKAKFKVPVPRTYRVYERRDGRPRVNHAAMRKEVNAILEFCCFTGCQPKPHQIARQVGRSTSCINRIIKEYKDPFDDEWIVKNVRGFSWSLDRKISRRKITHALEIKIEEWLRSSEEDPMATDIRAKLKEEHDVTVTNSTVLRCMKRLGFKCGRPSYRPLLTESHKAARVRWCIAHKEQDWSNVRTFI